jgi:hypothetical protein
MLGFDPIASLPLAALPTEVIVDLDVNGLFATVYLGSVESTVIWSKVITPVNDWTPIDIFSPT